MRVQSAYAFGPLFLLWRGRGAGMRNEEFGMRNLGSGQSEKRALGNRFWVTKRENIPIWRWFFEKTGIFLRFGQVFTKKGVDKWLAFSYNNIAFIAGAVCANVKSILGGITQLARVPGSYPVCRRFKSYYRHQYQCSESVAGHACNSKRCEALQDFLSIWYMARWSSG